MDQYKVLFDLDILVWMRFNLFGFSAPPFVRHIQGTSFSEVCDMRYWHQVPQAERTQVNMDDARLFEPAARGHARRLDKFKPDKRITKESVHLGRIPGRSQLNGIM